MSKKVLVTGASGFLGSMVIRELLKRGHKVVATSRSSEKISKADFFDKVTFVPYTLGETIENMFEYFHSPDAVIHLAWAGLPNYKELFHIEKNLNENYAFIKSLVKSGSKNISVAGTCFEYGLAEGELSEHMKTEPILAYALAKDILHKMMIQLKTKFDFHFTWSRIFYILGGTKERRTIFSMLDEALENGESVFNMSGGEQLRDYLTAEDTASYLVSVALQTEVDGAVNIGSGTPISIRTLIENYLKTIGKSIKLNLGYYSYPTYEPMAFWAHTGKLSLILENEKARR